MLNCDLSLMGSNCNGLSSFCDDTRERSLKVLHIGTFWSHYYASLLYTKALYALLMMGPYFLCERNSFLVVTRARRIIHKKPKSSPLKKSSGADAGSTHQICSAPCLGEKKQQILVK